MEPTLLSNLLCHHHHMTGVTVACLSPEEAEYIRETMISMKTEEFIFNTLSSIIVPAKINFSTFIC